MPTYGGYATLDRRLLVRILGALSEHMSATLYAWPAHLERHLTTKERLLLTELLEQPHQVARFDELRAAAFIETKNCLQVHIRRLRQKLAKYAPQLRIVTKRGIGYYVDKNA